MSKYLFIFFFLNLFCYSLFAQFVRIKNNSFILSDSVFYVCGFNAYYLQSEAAKGNFYIVDETIEFAHSRGFNVIRTWAFYDSEEPNNRRAIYIAPYKLNEIGMRALDYIVYKAKTRNIKLILCLANYFDDFGGIKVYLNWLKRIFPDRNFSKSDFYTNDSVKKWYKFYIYSILNRVNSYTGIAYKDESTIFSFELINEAENLNGDYRIIRDWYHEMSSYFKSINPNHLLSTGEVGYDVFLNNHLDYNFFYNSRSFLFDGTKGTSFIENHKLPNIDYLCFHLYPDGWGIHYKAGISWIQDKVRIANVLNKPLLLSEFGIKKFDKITVYKEWLNELTRQYYPNYIVWHFKHKDVVNYDGYGFNEIDSNLIHLLLSYKNKIYRQNDTIAINKEPILYQNFPNPFNPSTTILYYLPYDDFIEIDLYNILGENLASLYKGFSKSGINKLTLSFENNLLSSGNYLVRLKTKYAYKYIKINLIK